MNPGFTLLQRSTESDVQPAGAIMITPDRARPPTQDFVRGRGSRRLSLDAAAGGSGPVDEQLCIALVALLWRYSESDTVTIGVFDDVDQSGVPTPTPATFDVASTTTVDDLRSRLRQPLDRQPIGDAAGRDLADAVFDRHPLFQVAVACRVSAFDDDLLAEMIEDVFDSAIRCDLTFIAAHNGDTTTLICDYDADLFESATVDRLLAQWERLTTAIGDDPSRILSALDMMSAEERDRVLEWSRGARVERRTRTVHGLFAEQVARSPAAPAVAFGDSQLTYRELDDIAGKLADRFDDGGVGPQAKVVTCLRRSLRVPAVYLGVLQSANAFVPLDPESPVERAEAIFADLGPSLMICDSRGDAARFARSGTKVLILDDIWPELVSTHTAHRSRDVLPTDLAYVMYTSGSTGIPKGVMVEHASVCNRLQHNAFELGINDRVLQKTPLTFDVSLWEIFAPLIHGSQLVMSQPGGHRDPQYLISEIDRRSVTTVHFVPSMLREFLKDTRPGCCTSLRRVTSSGEALPLDVIREFCQQFPEVPLYNFYGPTEASIEVAFWRCEVDPRTRAVPIGRPIDNVTTYILDGQGQPTPIGVAGDLFLGGAALARGYTDPALDTGRFVNSHWDPTERLYASGDRARWLANGTIEYLGRNDRQVKIRGVRIELGEIENALLALQDVQDAAVITRRLTSTGQDLVAYVEARPAVEGLSVGRLRELLRPRLPAHMIPAEFVVVGSLPHNSAGKIDYNQLASLKGDEQRSATPLPRGNGALRELADTLGQIWRSVLERDVVGHDDNFFDLGGNSLLLAEVHRQLDELFPGAISRTDLFRLPTIESLSAHLSGTTHRSMAWDESSSDSTTGSGAIAIVGMACQTPGAADIDTFWELVQGQRREMRSFSDAELLDAGVDDAALSDPHYVRVGAVLDDPALFDADLFGMSPREAQITDPQHRLLLEAAHCALEDAGYGSAAHRPRCGVFVGGTPSGYFHRYLADGFQDLDPVQHYQIKIGNEIDFLPTLLAYKLDLRGPAMAVQTACSTSLVAVHLAAEALGRNECDIALAGGVTVRVPDRVGYRYQDGMVQSPDGHCRAFDNDAAGTVFGSGVGVVVLKRLEYALSDGDRIYAVIRGSAVNNDGADKVGYTAPSVRGQAEVIIKAHRQAGIKPCQIAYVEAHGTGTALGDPIEITALAEAFGADIDRSDVCTIGSVKANIGHLDAAAGVVGLIKTVLALNHGVRPGQCDVTEPSTRIPWSQTPFRVYTHATPWPENAPFAGVSAFGIGGTNAHVVLGPGPQLLPHAPVGLAEQSGMLAISARSPQALEALVCLYIQHLDRHPDANIVDLCRTAASGRTHHRYRIAAPVSTLEELADILRAFEQQPAGRAPGRGTAPDVAPRIAVILAGGFDDESIRFVLANLDSEIIAAAVGECRIAFGATTHSSDSQWLIETSPIQRTFTAQFAVTTLWAAIGLRPATIVGLGDGELAAAVWAGALDLNTAADYVRVHNRLNVDRLHLPDEPRRSGPELLIATQELDDVAIAHTLVSSNVELAVLLSGTQSVRASLREQLRRSGVRSIDNADRSHRGTWREFYGCAASLFIAGVNLDVAAAGPLSRGRRVGLPTYPMQRSRHWIDKGPATNVTQPVAPANQGLPGYELALPLSEERRFEMTFRRFAPAYADHHRLFGTMVIPGASHVAMVLAAARQVRSGPVALTDALFLHPFVLADAESRQTQLVLQPERGDGWGARLIAARQLSLHDDDHQWAELFRTSLTVANAAPASALTPEELAEIQHRCPQAMAGDVFYRDVWVPGLDTGNSFHWIDAIWRGRSEALALTRCPSDVQLGSEPIHPGLVEAAFQLLNSCWEYDTASLRQAGEIYVPYSIDRYYFHGQPTGERLWVHAEIADHARNDDTFSAGVKMYSPDGELVIAVEGFTARKISRTRVQDLLTTDQRLPLHSIGWQPSSQPKPARIADTRAVVVGSTQEQLNQFAEKLTVHGVDVVPVLAANPAADPPTDMVTFTSADEFAAILAAAGRDGRRTHIVDLRALRRPSAAERPVRSATDLSVDLLAVVNGIHPSSESTDPRLWWVTAAAQRVGHGDAGFTNPIAGSVWGLACAVRSERPEIRCTTVDLGSEPEADFELLAAELLSGDDDLRVGYRAQRRYVARIRPLAAQSSAHERLVRSDHVYLVTGGTSGLGLQVAAWLAAGGARHLILLGRRPVNDDVSQMIADITATGCAVHVGQVDVSTPDAVQQMRNLIAQAGARPLGGVIHAAGVVRDGTIARLSRAQVEAVMTPKVAGVHALEELIVQDQYEPDFVVLFSSTTAHLSAAGQANYAAANAYLDAIAHRLRARGISCTSVAWGPWAEVGMAARLTEAERLHTRGQGLSDITTKVGISTLGRLLGSDSATVIAAHVDWSTLRRSVASFGSDPFLDAAAPRLTRPTAEAPLRSQLRAVPAEERVGAISVMIESVVREAQGLPDDTALDRDRGLVEQGFDSLGLVDLRTRLQDGFGVRLPSTFGFDYPTIRLAAAHLATLVEGAESPTEPRPRTALSAPSAQLAQPAETVTDIDEELELLENMLRAEQHGGSRDSNGF